jgi:hypothetical protein
MPGKAKPTVKADQGAKGEKVAVVLSGSNPRIAKADGDAPVQAYIAGMREAKRGQIYFFRSVDRL